MQRVLDEGIFPRLVLEADAVACGAWPEQIEVPTGAPWMWVGLSRFCYLPRGVQLRDVGYEVEGDFVMMEGMCATHGVLILNEEGARRMQWAAVHGVRWDVPIDVAVILLSREKGWARIALRKPLVYQAGVNEKFTRIEVSDGGAVIG
jgi:hypothetical protein